MAHHELMQHDAQILWQTFELNLILYQEPFSRRKCLFLYFFCPLYCHVLTLLYKLITFNGVLFLSLISLTKLLSESIKRVYTSTQTPFALS